jgi:hypothetical protein
MNTRTLALAIALLAVPLAARAPDAGRLAPARLRSEYAVDPLGIDTATSGTAAASIRTKPRTSGTGVPR